MGGYWQLPLNLVPASGAADPLVFSICIPDNDPGVPARGMAVTATKRESCRLRKYYAGSRPARRDDGDRETFGK